MKLMLYVMLFFIGFAASLSIAANPGCLTNRGGFNNTQRTSVRPVTCYCPCDRYHHDPRRNTCVRCGHAHADSSFGTMRIIPKLTILAIESQ